MAKRLVVGGRRRCGIGRADEDDQRAHRGASLVEERGVLRRLGARDDASPNRELRGCLTLLAVPRGEDAQRRGIVLGATQQILDGLGARAEGSPHVRATEPRCAQPREMLERDVVDTLCLAQIASPSAQPAEPDVSLLAGRIEREGLGVTAQREVVLVSDLVRARDAHQLERARREGRRRRPEHHAADERNDGRRPPHADEDSAIVESMWPFGREKVWDRLAAASAHGGAQGGGPPEPVHVSVLTTIVSPSLVVSPFTGMRAGILLVELLERIPVANEGDSGVTSDVYAILGTVVLGDLATLRDEDGDEITVVARRAQIKPALPRRGGTPITHMPPEVAPLLQRSSGRGGVLCYRELTLSTGDKLRLRAVVEPTQSIVADGYRSGTRLGYVARDDLGPVVLEEIFETPAW